MQSGGLLGLSKRHHGGACPAGPLGQPGFGKSFVIMVEGTSNCACTGGFLNTSSNAGKFN